MKVSRQLKYENLDGSISPIMSSSLITHGVTPVPIVWWESDLRGRVLANPRKDTLHHGPLCSSSLERRDLPTRKRRETTGNGIAVFSAPLSRFICRGSGSSSQSTPYCLSYCSIVGRKYPDRSTCMKNSLPQLTVQGYTVRHEGWGSSGSLRQLVTLCPQSQTT